MMTKIIYCKFISMENTLIKPIIKASELRIGNWMKDVFGSYFQISADDIKILSEKGMMMFQSNPPKAGFEPIPLTPEILGKCGFKERERREGEWIEENIEIHKEEDGFAVFASEWTIGKPFKCLHQLQNVYFALTDEELNIAF